MLGDGKSVVLTFDDGPAPVDALESILQTLEQHEIRAISGTFSRGISNEK